jgi:hypothetical protein
MTMILAPSARFGPIGGGAARRWAYRVGEALGVPSPPLLEDMVLEIDFGEDGGSEVETT